jgi:hypothetical protein
MDRKALKEAAVVLCALSKWEYWHGNKERSEQLTRMATHLLMVANFSTHGETNAMGSYLRGAERLVAQLMREMESASWPE